jgi:CBS domain-containing protein
MTVAAVLRQKGNNVVAIAPSATVAEIAGMIAARRIGAVVVVDGANRLVGIVSERDVVRALDRSGAACLDVTAADIMTQAVATATPETSINEALEIMDEGYFRHLPVLVGGQLAGIVSIRDLVKHQLQTQAHHIESLTTYVTRSY